MAVIKKFSAVKKIQKHLLGIQNLSIKEAKLILDEAKNFISLNRSASKKLDLLRGQSGEYAKGDRQSLEKKE